MGIVQAVKGSLGAKVALKLSLVLVLLTVVAAVAITAHQESQLRRLTLEKAKTAAILGARYYGETLDHAIDAGLLTVGDVFDRTYVPIKGYDWGNNPRFHTRYDTITDALVLAYQDRVLEDPDFLFAIGQDDRNYVPTHDSIYSQAPTGNPEQDALNNTKSRTTDVVRTRAAENTQAVLVQDYLQKRTGRWAWDVSSPITVKGKHWGAFRVGVSKERVAEAQRTLLWILIGLFGAFLAVTVGTLYLVVRQAMRPVVALTAAAEQVSLGEALDAPIKPTTTDEIGHLTKAIDRLRISMRAAMSRLGQ